MTISSRAVINAQIAALLADNTSGAITPSDVRTIVTDVFQSASNEYNVRDYGAVGDGITDDWNAIQQAFDAVALTGGVVYFPTGIYKTTNSNTISNPHATVNYGFRIAIRGDGPGLSVILNSSPSLTYAWLIGGDFNSFSGALNVEIRGICFQRLNNTQEGFGLLANQLTQITIAECAFNHFNVGCFLRNCLNVLLVRPVFYGNYIGLDGDSTGLSPEALSHPNSWTLLQPSFLWNSLYGMYLVSPSDINVIGGDFEHNGTASPSSSCTIFIDGNGAEGTAGLKVIGGYFSLNQGDSDIFINAAGSNSAVHSFIGCEFQKANQTFVESHIYINKATNTELNIVVEGCAFNTFGTYVPSPGRPAIAITASDTNYNILSIGNIFGATVEAYTKYGIYSTKGLSVASVDWQSTNLTLINGLNSDTSLPATGRCRITQSGSPSVPNVAFSLGGFVAPLIGGPGPSRLRIYNPLSLTMTIVNEDPSSFVGHRIVTLTGANIVMRASAPSFVTLGYDFTQARWVVEALN